MSWIIFDERGERAQKLTLWNHTDTPTRGWSHIPPTGVALVVGFEDGRGWRPTYFAAAMARGYRVFGLDRGEFAYLTQEQVSDLWQPATPDQKRLPTIAAVEMWVRHQVMRDG